MSAAHVGSLTVSAEESTSGRIGRRPALLIGSVALFALAAMPIVFTVLLATRPDLLLPH